MNTSQWRVWLIALLIFSLGAAAGGSAATWLGVRFLQRSFRAPATSPGLADLTARRIGDDLTDALKLTQQQAEEVQSLLRDSAAHLKAIRAQAALQVAAALRDSRERITSILPADKREEFSRVVRKRYERLGLPPPEH